MPEIDVRVGRAPQQARSKQKVARILNEASRIIVDNGLGGLTMRSVAQAAGVGQATLYSYFPTPDALIKALVDRVVSEARARLDQIPRTTPETPISQLSRDFLAAIAHVYETQPVVHHLVDASGSDGETTVEDVLERTAFRESFSTSLTTIQPQIDKARAEMIAMGFFRIADGFLWQPPPSLADMQAWRDLLMDALAGYLCAASEGPELSCGKAAKSSKM